MTNQKISEDIFGATYRKFQILWIHNCPVEYEWILFPFLLTVIIKDTRAVCDIFEENSNWEISRKVSL